MEILTIVFCAALFLLLLFLYKENRTRSRFESNGIMYIGNGNIRLLKNAVKKIPIIDVVTNLYRYIKGKGEKMGATNDLGVNTVFITDPELFKSVFVKDFDHFSDRRVFDGSKNDYLFGKMLIALRGQEWRSLRSKLSPTFTTGNIKRLFPIFENSGQKLMKYFQGQAEASEDGEIDLSEGYSKYAMDIIASAACGLNSQAFDQKEPSIFEKIGLKLQLDLSAYSILKFVIVFTLKPLADLLGLSFIDLEVQDFFSKAIKGTIKDRQEKNEKRNDFIQLMLEAREGSLKIEDSELDNFEKDAMLSQESSESNKARDYSELLDDDGIVANAVLFILAGVDTTQTLLLFTPYVIALNPEIQDRVRAEVEEILEDHGGKFTYEGISKMTYLDMVINETLRMYPPAPSTDRRCTMDYKIPGTDFVLKKGEGIGIPIYAIHHDPAYYPEPEKFDPERFSPENKGKIKPYTYLPFGQGPRNCIGMRFALVEVKMAIAHLVHNFKISPSKKTLIPMQFSSTSSFKPKGGMYLAVHKITAN